MIRVISTWSLVVWIGLALAVPMYSNDRFEGDTCKLADNTTIGVCRHTQNCAYLKSLPKKQWVTCSFEPVDTPIVCCLEEFASPKTPLTQTRLSSKSELKCAGFPNASALTEHIFGGDLAEPNEFPHVAALGYPAAGSEVPFRCGASLISDRFLLTAAHCLSPDKPIFARLAVNHLLGNNPNDPPVDVMIKTVIPHPNYSARPLMNDIALLELNRTITEAFIQPACLYTSFNDPSPDVVLSIEGWGSRDPNDPVASLDLRKANVTTLDRAECNSSLAELKSRRNSGALLETQLCALGRNNQNETIGDTCVGDSGGPLEILLDHRRYIVGVTSSGKLCGTKWPGIYTRVSRYVDWIESIVWPNKQGE